MIQIFFAAKYALELHNLKRILILDWDVHHGNGIQNMFYDDPRVLYISIHRYDNGFFFPCKEDANYDYIGSGHGKGKKPYLQFYEIFVGLCSFFK